MDTARASRHGKVILIVEDEVISAMMLQHELADAGYDVLDLTDRPHEALMAARARKPDLALVNIQLHGVDDGLALAADFKGMGIPVLFISGQVSRARTAQTVAAGSLPKPYSAVHMVKAVDYLLHHLAGDETVARPPGLEVFGEAPDEQEPEAA